MSKTNNNNNNNNNNYYKNTSGLSFSLNIPIINISSLNEKENECNNHINNKLTRSNSFCSLKYPPLSPNHSPSSQSLNNSTSSLPYLKPIYHNNNNNNNNNNINKDFILNNFIEEIYDNNSEESSEYSSYKSRTLSPLFFNNNNNSQISPCHSAPCSPSLYSSSPIYPSSPIQSLNIPPLSPNRIPSSPNSLSSGGSLNISSLNIHDKNELINSYNSSSSDESENINSSNNKYRKNTINSKSGKAPRRHVSKTIAQRNSILAASATVSCSASSDSLNTSFGPDEKIYYCDHLGCNRGFSSPQSRSNHYSLKHSTPCTNESKCQQCIRVLKIKNSPKSKCRHFGCDKICSSANLAKHEKTHHHKHNFLEKFSCPKCDDLASHGYRNSLPSIADLTH